MGVLDYEGLQTYTNELKNYLSADHIKFTPAKSKFSSYNTVKKGLDYTLDYIDTCTKVYFVSCSTAEATQTKTCSITNFEYITGTIIFVNFTNANSAANPILSVNGTGKTIRRNTGDSASVYWNAGAAVPLVYNGTYWIAMGGIRLNLNEGGTGATNASGVRSNINVSEAGTVNIGGTVYTLRTGTGGAAGYITFVT